MSNEKLLADLFETGKIELRRGALFERAPVRHSAAVASKIEGMLLGLAIGDSLGNTSEGMRPGRRRAAHGEIRDYLPNRHARSRTVGLPSDDTQLAFWTLEQMLEDDGLVPENLARRFASRPIFGIGSSVTRFLYNRARGTLPWYECGPHSAGNGALMRIAPVLVPHLREPSPGLWSDTALAAIVTHNDSASTAACLAFVDMLWELIAMSSPPPAAWWLERYVGVARELELEKGYAPRGGAYLDYRGPVWRYTEQVLREALANELSVLEGGKGWYSGAYLLETVPSVLYILMRHGDSFEEAVVRAVNDTKDNDTVAAIVGAAAGALHGVRAIPERWIDGLTGRTGADDDGQVFRLIERAKARWFP